MSDQKHSPDGQVLRFRHRRSAELVEPDHPLADDDFAKFEQSSEPDDYRHRMTVNLAAIVVIAGLIGGGLWLATAIADLRKTQDCALTGRRGCAPIAVEHSRY